MNLDCLDFLGISSLLTDEEIMVQKTTKNFAQNEIAPIIEDCFVSQQHLMEEAPNIREKVAVKT